MGGDKSKKRKRTGGHDSQSSNKPYYQQHQQQQGEDTSKPTAVFTPTGKPRRHTLSVALPGSFLNNAHSFELKNILAGQIARALAVFSVDEVVIFNDGVVSDHSYAHAHSHSQHQSYNTQSSQSSSSSASKSPNDFLALLLSYLETPPHMRRKLFPMNPDLQKAGLLPSLDMPHHLRRDEWCQYREGVVVESNRQTTAAAESDLVDIGTGEAIRIGVSIPVNTRVTIKFGDDVSTATPAAAVAPSAPREEAGWYWGYDVRSASSLSDVFTECPWEGGYDVSVGTSERGIPVSDVIKLFNRMDDDDGDDDDHGRQGQQQKHETVVNGETGGKMEKVEALQGYQHLLLVFGGHQGLEVAVRNDSQLSEMGVDKPEMLFDWWVNLCPAQGSRTIRTEEAIWLGLMAFRDVVEKRSHT